MSVFSFSVVRNQLSAVSNQLSARQLDLILRADG
jgi:hypothetical protein